MATSQMDLRTDLIDWRKRLETAIDESDERSHLASLLSEVDSALHRMQTGSAEYVKSVMRRSRTTRRKIQSLAFASTA